MSTISGKYYTLPDGRILRQFYSMTGVYKYKYVDSIPEERIGSAKQTDLALISTILDFIPILSNIKGGIEASLGQDIITDRKLGIVERSILVAAILGGPLVKGAQKFGKLAMCQLPKVKNVLNPDKAKALAKDFYDDYIKSGIQSGYTAVNGLVKKMADLPMPLSPKLSTANGMSVTKTIGESMTEAKETIVQMAGKVKTSVSGKGTGDTKKTKTINKEKFENAMVEAVRNQPPYTRKPNKPRNFKSKVRNEDGTTTYTFISKKNGKEYNVAYDKKGFPKFNTKHEISLPEKLYLETDAVQFDYLSKSLHKEIKGNPELATKFTKQEIELLEAGKVPQTLTWHHNQQPGKMQIVDYFEHQSASHTGGRAIWGGGEAGRKGEIKKQILEMISWD